MAIGHGDAEKMSWGIVEIGISLDDPEAGFSFTKSGGNVTLRYRDWQNNEIVITFVDVSKFAYSCSPPYPKLGGGAFYEAADSEHVRSLRDAEILGKAEEAHHYLIATNEDQWCEVVAARYEVAVNP